MNPREISRRYDRIAPVYEQHDALEREVGERLLERVEFARLAPKLVLDLGCGTGRASQALAERFPGSRVIALDLSPGMLAQTRARTDGQAGIHAVCGDFSRLPVASRSADLVFCNLSLQWADDFVHALNEARRALRPGGMLLFSVPGPDSLLTLRQGATAGADSTMPIYMLDLRDVGDCLVSAGFRDPVMDSEIITLSYSEAAKMHQELEITGGAGFAALAAGDGGQDAVEISFEIVYGAAFGPEDGQPVRTQEGEVATFAVNQLKTL